MRPKKMPEIEYISRSVFRNNNVVHERYRNPGFVDGYKLDQRESYLKLDGAAKV